jgi:hypothetical protein
MVDAYPEITYKVVESISMYAEEKMEMCTIRRDRRPGAARLPALGLDCQITPEINKIWQTR